MFVGLTVAAPTATEAQRLAAFHGSLKITGVTGGGNVRSIHQRLIALSHLIGIETLPYPNWEVLTVEKTQAMSMFSLSCVIVFRLHKTLDWVKVMD